MNDKERDKAFKKERSQRIKDRASIQRATHAEIMQLLQVAQDDIQNSLRNSPSQWEAWYLPQVQQSITTAMTTFSTGASAVIGQAAGKAWQAGLDLIDKPIAAAGVNITSMLPSIDTKQLSAMRTFMTDRMSDIGATVAAKINGQLGLVVIGTQGTGDAISQVANIIDQGGRSRATTIVRTELGRAYSTAAQERKAQAAKLLPGLKKQWRRSGKIHSRIEHDAVDGQIQPVDQPFIVGGVPIMYPHDPKAPAAHTINCGCISLPIMDDWEVSTPGKKPFTSQELALSPNKRNLAAAQKAGPVELQAPKVRKVVRDIEKNIGGQAIEHAAVIDQSGNVLLEKVGDATRVGIAADELKLLKGNIITHNHPGVGSFSEGDVRLATVYEVAELRVVDDKYAYSMRPPQSGWNENLWLTAIQPTLQTIEAEVMGEFMDALLAGKITQELMEENYQHEVWRRVNKLINLNYLRRRR